MKHTEGILKVDGIFVCREDIPATKDTPAAATGICTMDADGISVDEAKINAQRVVLCWNSHDGLLEACKYSLEIIDTMQEYITGLRKQRIQFSPISSPPIPPKEPIEEAIAEAENIT